MIEIALEVFAAIGAPARILGRLPLIVRYFWAGGSKLTRNNAYAESRYGKHYRLRPWLMFDVDELEVVEHLINKASDKNILQFRHHQLEAAQLVAIVVCREFLFRDKNVVDAIVIGGLDSWRSGNNSAITGIGEHQFRCARMSEHCFGSCNSFDVLYLSTTTNVRFP